jgi:hypothetical protein
MAAMFESIGRFSGRVALAASLILLATATSASEPVEQKVTSIRDRFVAAVRDCGISPQFEPAVTIATEPAVIAYRGNTRALVIGRWEALPPPIKEFFTQWAASAMPGRTGADLFDALFNGFLVGHELGHWVADQSGRLETIDFYEAEIEANQFAIAFAELSPESSESVEKTVAQFSYLRTLPRPISVDRDERAYFNDNYWTMPSRDPLAYNWYQGRFMQMAWERRQSTNFCQLVRKAPEQTGRAPGR